MKRLLILGATGSIGQNALAVARAHPSRFQIAGLAAAKDVENLTSAAAEFDCPAVAITDSTRADELRERLRGRDCRIFGGAEAAIELARECGADVCVAAIPGTAGLAPAFAAVDAGMDVCLAAKEALVAAGALLLAKAREKNIRLLPVDSEHAALHQCLRGRETADVRRLVLTASGGPFRGWSADRLRAATADEALRHPVWRMGRKVSVDSATLANKALEVIEAHHWFGLPYDRLDVLVHPQSIVHGIVEWTDGTLLIQAAAPDMRTPIQYAMLYPDIGLPLVETPDLARLGALTFEEPDRAAFPLLDIGLDAGRRGGLHPAVFSAANEAAGEGFLAGRLSFGDMAPLVEKALMRVPSGAADSLDVIADAEREARRAVEEGY